MKEYKIPVVSAIIGCALTIAVFLAFDFKGNEIVRIEHLTTDVPSYNALFTLNDAGEIVPLNFVEISKRLMGAVVHISSAVTVEQRFGGRSPLPDPFRDFFGEEFFERYNEQQRERQQQPPRQRHGSGSGVIINSEGYIVTNNHVIANADEIEVTLHDNRSYIAEVLGTDPMTDLALIKIDETNLSTIPLVDSDNTEVGEWVLAIGNPFNLNSTVTAGIISAKSRNINILREQYAIESFLQTDAAINPGNSGGALVNMQGGLIGINTAIASQTGTFAGYGFAVPSNIVNKVIEDILEFGKVQRGYLGVVIRPVTSTLAREEGLGITQGVYIDSVMTGSAAERAGIQSGDVVVEIEGRVVNRPSELQEVIGGHRPGDEIEMEIVRKGKNIKRTATLLSSEGTTQIVAPRKGQVNSALGAELVELSKEEAAKFGVNGGVQIISLQRGKLMTETEIKEGFIILRVNNQPVRTVEQLTGLLEKTSGGVMLEGFYPNAPKSRLYYAFGM
jgi:serine protease Do